MACAGQSSVATMTQLKAKTLWAYFMIYDQLGLGVISFHLQLLVGPEL